MVSHNPLLYKQQSTSHSFCCLHIMNSSHINNQARADLIRESNVVERQRQLAQQLGAVQPKHEAPPRGETDQQRLLRLALQAKQQTTKLQQQQKQPAAQNNKKKKKKKKKKGSISNVSVSASASSNASQHQTTDLLGTALVSAPNRAAGSNVGQQTVTSREKVLGTPVVSNVVKKNEVTSAAVAKEVLNVNALAKIELDDIDTAQKQSAHKRPLKRSPLNSNPESTSSSTGPLKRARILKKSARSTEPLFRALTKFTVEDFWRAVRSWDFQADIISDMNQRNKATEKKDVRALIASSNSSIPENGDSSQITKSGNRKKSTEGISRSNSDEEEDDEEGELSEAIPDTFPNSFEYINVWAPLLLAEMKAQLISEVQGNKKFSQIDWSNIPQGCNMRVLCSPLMRDVGTATDYVSVQLRMKKKNITVSQDGKNEFLTNDIILLMVPIDLVGEIARRSLVPAGLEKSSRRCLVGHVEQSRKSAEGLIVKVSRELWQGIGCNEMYLLNFGSNVTAIREYTSLTRVNSIPILSELLAGSAKWSKTYTSRKLPSSLKQKGFLKKARVSFSDELIVGPFVQPGKSKKQEASEHISKLGGVEALGKGWVDYASARFNTSQLEAISAAATDYGSGGFTLIKGPPGTGKVSIILWIIILF